MRKHVDELLMLVVALIYGFSYSAQSAGAQYVEAFSFSAIKNIIAFVSLLIVYLVRNKRSKNFKKALWFGFLIAIVLLIFDYFQQIVALQNTPGKTGFITSMYIVEVPLLSFLFFKDKINLQTLISLIFAVAGLVCLCNLNNFSIELNDCLTIISSFCLCIQIIVVGRYCFDVDPIEYAMCSSLFTAIFSVVGAIIAKEPFDFNAYGQALWPLLYVGIVCTSIAIPIQNFAQKTLNETAASLILSLESLFSVFAGFLLFDEAFSKKELIGCLLMFIAVILCVTAEKQKQ